MTHRKIKIDIDKFIGSQFEHKRHFKRRSNILHQQLRGNNPEIKLRIASLHNHSYFSITDVSNAFADLNVSHSIKDHLSILTNSQFLQIKTKHCLALKKNAAHD